MTKVPKDLRHIFFHKIPPILKLEVGFFSDRKKFFADFRKLDMFISPEVYFYKKKKKIGEPFWIIHHHHSSSSFRLGVGRLGRGEGLSAQESRGQAFLTFSSFVFFLFLFSLFHFFSFSLFSFFPFFFLFFLLFLFFL